MSNANKTHIENIRRIAKTEEILKRLPNGTIENDKASIGGTRGTASPSDGAFNPCQYLYRSTDGVYDVADIIDGTDGPKATDGTNNQCTTLNTITGMREIGVSPTLKMVLKPDGQFLPSIPGYMYTSATALALYSLFPAEFDPVNKWAFSTPEDLVTGLSTILPAVDISFGTVVDTHIDAIDLPNTFIGDFNYSYDYPIYSYAIFFDNTVSNGSFDGGLIIGLPYNYDFTVDSQSLGYPAPLIDGPLTNVSGNIAPFPNGLPVYTYTYSTFTAYIQLNTMDTYQPGDDTGITTNDSFQLAIDIGFTNLWKPNPDETTYPTKYTNGVSVVNFEFGTDYTRTGQVRPAKDGGFALFETVGDVPTGTAYIYRQNRTLAIAIPAAQLAPYLA